MNNYEAPVAQIVLFGTVDILLASGSPEVLNTWGKGIDIVDSANYDLFG